MIIIEPIFTLLPSSATFCTSPKDVLKAVLFRDVKKSASTFLGASFCLEQGLINGHQSLTRFLLDEHLYVCNQMALILDNMQYLSQNVPFKHITKRQ